MANKRQRYTPVGKKLIPVSEEIYLYHSRWVAKERYQARRDHRCGSDNYSKCNGDCGHCIHQIPGDVLYIDSVISTDRDHAEDGDFGFDIPDARAAFEDRVIDELMLASLLKDLDGIMPDGGRIFSLIAHGFTERQVADNLGISQSTLNYRKNKLFDYIRQHRADLLR
jgi:hypothetical protein